MAHVSKQNADGVGRGPASQWGFSKIGKNAKSLFLSFFEAWAQRLGSCTKEPLVARIVFLADSDRAGMALQDFLQHLYADWRRRFVFQLLISAPF